MPYVILTADPSWASEADRDILRDNHAWAQQVDTNADHAADDFQEVEIPRRPRAEADQWAAIVDAYARAAAAAGSGGTLGIMLGHGAAGSNPTVDLAPPEMLRVQGTDLQVWGGCYESPVDSPNRFQNRSRHLEDIRLAIRGAGLSRIDLLCCEVGDSSAHELLRRLVLRFNYVDTRAGESAIPPIGVRGLNQYLASEGTPGRRTETDTGAIVGIQMFLVTRSGDSYRRTAGTETTDEIPTTHWVEERPATSG